jgi:hypothetical protein
VTCYGHVHPEITSQARPTGPPRKFTLEETVAKHDNRASTLIASYALKAPQRNPRRNNEHKKSPCDPVQCSDGLVR